ncbi:P-loop containing nucleoside triphosphate hydrolase protein [Gymnopus androsaceus JB14]|uniref:DNA 3'-5' helicase n=1 Tax=Gymnopus androsaceus JB14 TaxID=1447944 RepID=A0A6A4H021_9AGAR|nr:P-loop containing nucleoside triphosphate hydrolase protein [Gymnopus androsaceus JB14]
MTGSSIPRHAQQKNASQKAKRRRVETEKHNEPLSSEPLTDKDLESLDEHVKAKFHKDYTLKDFQLAATNAQLQRKDTIVHAHTGAGKTAIVAAPHAHPATQGKVTFLVSPLIALQDEQAETFREEYNLSAIAINSSHGGLTAKNMAEICTGKYQVVVISPEMLLTKRFTRNVIKNRSLARRVLSIVIDEAHVISHWGSGFRKKYGEMGILRTLLPKGIPFVALSATLPPRVREDIFKKLHFSKKDGGYVDINIGNDRPNVSLAVRAMQHPMNTFKDLDFLIPQNTAHATDLKKTFIYCDDTALGTEIQDHLEELLPDELKGQGLIRPYSAVYSKSYRTAVMKLFKAGIVRILVCTDAAGMGCNIPDVDIVVQWKLPGTLSMFIQRAGRAARAQNRKGLAVLLVEKSAYGLDCERLVNKLQAGTKSSTRGRGKGKGKGKPTENESTRTTGEYEKSTEKNYMESHGVKRGSYDGKSDTHPKAGWEPRIDFRAKDEGLLPFTQTGSCRRNILTQVYKNQPPIPLEGVSCCDICDPSLLDSIRPGYYRAPPRQTAVTKGVPYKPTQLALNEWRISTYKMYHSDDQWTFEAILGGDLIKLLASVGPIKSFERLEKILGTQWGWWDHYGQNLWETIEKLEMPELVPLPKGTKRKESEDMETGASQSKRGRIGSSGGGGNESEAIPALTSVHQHAYQPHVPANLPVSRQLPSTAAGPATPANSNHRHYQNPPRFIHDSPAYSGYYNQATSYPSPMPTPHNPYPYYHNQPNAPVSNPGNQYVSPGFTYSPSFQTPSRHLNPVPFLFHPDQSPLPPASQPFRHPNSNPPPSQPQYDDLARLNPTNYSEESQFFESSPGFRWDKQ